ncbi:MAG: protein kinase domain-containing protein [Myxococcota bacterium]
MAAPASGQADTAGEHPLAVRPFGKYFLVRKIAEGGMAEIFLAKQVGAEGFERNVVIKRMLQHISSVPDFVGMFLDEARLAARLAHPNIIGINDLGLADGCYYICMEYLAGEDFSTVLRTARRRREYVPLQVVMRVIADAAHGLHFAHDFADDQGKPLNIVHRDISPSNIYVTYQGQVKLLDFGIAKAESRVTNTTAGVVKGKYMYMSPEQARSGAVDRRSDVFSLGLSLYEAVTNIRPFARDNDLAILNAVLQCDYVPPRKMRSDLPPEVETIIVKALAPKVEDRYQTAGAMAADIERFLGATTSASGGAMVATYLCSLFGEERLANKTRIPTLASLAQSGVDVPGFSNPYSPKTDPEVDEAAKDAATRAVGQPPTVQRALRRRRGVGALGLLAVLAVAGVTWGVFRPGWTPSGGGGGKPVGSDDAGAEAPVTKDLDAGKVAEVVDAGEVAERVEVPPKPPPKGVKPISLTLPIIQGVVKKRSGAIMKCMEQHKADLPADIGQLNVNFTIVSSGKVSQAKSDLSDKAVGRCVEGQIRALRFPLHTDREVSLTLPFRYTIKR